MIPCDILIKNAAVLMPDRSIAKNQTIAPKTWHCVWRSADRWTWRHVHIRFDVNHDSAQKKHII